MPGRSADLSGIRLWSWGPAQAGPVVLRVERIRGNHRACAGRDCVCWRAGRLARRLVFERGQEFGAEVEPGVPVQHLSPAGVGELFRTPPRYIPARRDL